MGTMKDTLGDSELRQRAEKEIAIEAGSTELLSEMSPEKIAGLIHELQVHQIELKMQNEELRQIQDKLEKTRDRYSHLYDFAPIGYFTVNPKGIIHEANLTIASMLGLDRSALIGQPFPRFVLRDDQDTFYKHRQRLLETELPQSFGLGLVKNDGHVFYARLECNIITNEEDNDKQIRAAVSDVTEQKQAEEAFRESEERYRLLTQQSLTGIFIHVGGLLKFVNNRFAEMLGYAPEELVGRQYWDFIHPEDREMVKNISLARARGEVAPPEYEFRHKSKDGETVWVHNLATIIQYQGQTANMGNLAQINNRKRAEKELGESEEKYRNVLESMEEGYYEVDMAGNFTFFNDALCRIRGYTKDELMGMNNREYMDAKTAKKVYKAYNEVYRTGRPIKGYQWKTMRKDGTEGYVEVSVALIKDLKDKPIGFRGIVRDINERIQVEKEKARLEAQLQQSQKMEAVGTLAGGIAHDFNNILSAVIGYSELALMDVPEGSKVSHDIQEVLTAGKRAKDLVKQILTFARTAGDEAKPIQVKYILKEALKMLKASVPSSIEIRETIESDATILANPTQIYQVIMNLCTNAVQAMKDEIGVMKVHLKEVSLDRRFAEHHPKILPGNYLQLCVEDNGHGISQDLLQKIFDPYFTTKSIGEGTGLGLSVTKGIVDGCKGAITIKSQIGKGSIFDAYFPILEPTSREFAPKWEKEETPTGDEAVLVIDDDISLARLTQQLLKTLGYRATGQTSSIEALELFKSDPDRFDLVITDMTMPQMTGDLLAMEIKKIRPDIPVILCTGYSRRMSEEVARTIGIDAFLMKPVVKLEMAKTVRKVLDEK